MPRAWVRVNKKAGVAADRIERDIRECLREAKAENSPEHPDGDHYCVGVDPATAEDEFRACMEKKEYEAQLSAPCKEKHGRREDRP